MGGLFATVYLVLFWPLRGSWVADIGGDWWTLAGFGSAWPAYGVMVALLSALVAATVVDARTFLIPAGITTTLMLAAFAGWALQAMLPSPTPAMASFPIPLATWPVVWITLGAAAGTLIACVLLRTGRIRRSFADYEDYVPEGDVLAEYPHGRREMGIEILFLLPILLGGIAGWGIHILLQPEGSPPELLEVLGGSAFGWFIGGGLVWAIRILGTLAFGREAMGMGDVHLLAGIGAALGWIDPIRIFFLAPFIALAWIAVTRLVATLRGRSTRELPYGPHLAAATVLVMVARPFVDELQRMLLQPPN
jgi:leader peptidase (prepilin peptidase)/N-methyltransferase